VDVGGIYTSTNSGSTWAKTTAPHEIWLSVASSADGTVLAAAGWPVTYAGGVVYNSTNSGATWRSNSFPYNWVALASSADGSHLAVAAGGNGGPIYTTSDFGASWHPTTVPKGVWYSITSSADGRKVVAAGDYIYTSEDSGATWTSNSVPLYYWGSVASSADGSKVVVVRSQAIYVHQSIPNPLLSIVPTQEGMLVSWTVPSQTLVLQQNADLFATNWSDVSTPPTTANLQSRVALPFSIGSMFYRLISR